MDQIVECVPNFSEGRDGDVIRTLAEVVKSVPGVWLLDQHMDHDHHRSVLTFAGIPQAVAEAAFQVTRLAVERIDLRHHHGAHPRVGATDVVPFIPIKGSTMAECVSLAFDVGRRIGSELRVPVFLYEQAARHPNRKNLEAIRKGGLKDLAERVARDPTWVPDFGPPQLHPTAGATVVGARPPLIAFNVNLQTNDLSIAQAIARKIRFSNGGLPCLKAIGVDLASRGLVQVSMNLMDFERTPLKVAFDAVQQEAGQHGVRIAESELIGLVPAQALMQVSPRVLLLKGLCRSQTLETRLEEAMSSPRITGGVS